MGRFVVIPAFLVIGPTPNCEYALLHRKTEKVWQEFVGCPSHRKFVLFIGKCTREGEGKSEGCTYLTGVGKEVNKYVRI